MEFLKADGDAGEMQQAQALLFQMEVSPMKSNLTISLEMLQRNAFLLQEIDRLARIGEEATGGGDQSGTMRNRHILEVNANLYELARLYAALGDIVPDK